ncbi:MAG TPA: hypothetical protein VFS02_21255 [Telluria sp.]|nr:hypothetical protein [Telluria sp.]
MMGIFKWPERGAAVDTSALGTAVVAMPLPSASTVPPACTGVIVGQGGHTRRALEGGRLALAPGETAYAFHPGPYGADLRPFAQAPEIGLRVTFAVDCPDPRVTQQRFDLFLASEAQGPLAVAGFCAAIDAALQHELAQGNLDLPPCTTLAEWNTFRAGFNQLLYMRFGVTVEECVPVDLGESVDFAQILLSRTTAPPPAMVAAPALVPETASDARCLRRLFLELPSVMCALRLAVLPSGQEMFRRHQDLLRRLDLVSLSVATMPAFDLAAPGVPLEAHQQARRIVHSRRAAAALDEAWALLSRLQVGGDAQLDDAERIVANLEYDIGERRLAESAPP